ncbi:unnamed protein product [Victoria cruziana]
MISFIIGLLPYTDNFANVGSLISGILLGAMCTFDPKGRRMNRNQESHPHGLKVLPISFVGLLMAVFYEVDGNKYCTWCHHLNCVSVKKRSCSENDMPCQTTVGSARLTLTCQTNGKFKVFPYADVSMTRLKELCNQFCS